MITPFFPRLRSEPALSTASPKSKLPDNQMNYRSILLLASLIIACPSCKRNASSVSGKSDDSSENTSQHAFNPQRFITFDGSEAISIVSQNELEMTHGDQISVCKYTQQERQIRAISNVFGTTQAFYFQITSDGLEGSDGTVYFTPHKLQRAREIKLAGEIDQAVQAWMKKYPDVHRHGYSEPAPENRTSG